MHVAQSARCYGCLRGQACSLRDEKWIFIAAERLHCGAAPVAEGVDRPGTLRDFSLLLLYVDQEHGNDTYSAFVHGHVACQGCHPWRYHHDYRATVVRSDVAPILSLLLFLASPLSEGSPPTVHQRCSVRTILRGSRLHADLSGAQHRDTNVANSERLRFVHVTARGSRPSCAHD